MSEYEINELKVKFVEYINHLQSYDYVEEAIGQTAICVSDFINYLESKEEPSK